jgi:dTDP-4-dehydrorhamnose 3,5-epimerase
MNSESLSLPEVIRFTPDQVIDPRGRSCEVRIPDVSFSQSRVFNSVPWSLHGIYSNGAGRLVRCLSGSIFLAAVDLRDDSATYLQSTNCRIDGTTQQAVWVPPGFGYGFLADEQGVTVLVEQTEPSVDQITNWNSPSLSIPWPLMRNMKVITPILSNQDRAA